MRGLSIIVVLCLAATAAAQPAGALKPEAQVHLDAFLKAYADKDFDTALKELDLAYAADPSPVLLYSKAQTLRLANRCAEAIPVYKQFLGEKITSDQTAAAKTGIATCEQVLAAQQPVEPKPEPEPEPKPVVQEPPPVPKDPPQQRRWWRDPIGGALVGAGAIAIGAGLVFRVKGGSTEKAAGDAEFRDDFLSKLDDAERQKRLGAISLIGGGVLITTGIITYVVRRSSKPTVTAGTDGRVLFVAGAF